MQQREDEQRQEALWEIPLATQLFDTWVAAAAEVAVKAAMGDGPGLGHGWDWTIREDRDLTAEWGDEERREALIEGCSDAIVGEIANERRAAEALARWVMEQGLLDRMPPLPPMLNSRLRGGKAEAAGTLLWVMAGRRQAVKVAEADPTKMVLPYSSEILETEPCYVCLERGRVAPTQIGGQEFMMPAEPDDPNSQECGPCGGDGRLPTPGSLRRLVERQGHALARAKHSWSESDSMIRAIEAARDAPADSDYGGVIDGATLNRLLHEQEAEEEEGEAGLRGPGSRDRNLAPALGVKGAFGLSMETLQAHALTPERVTEMLPPYYEEREHLADEITRHEDTVKRTEEILRHLVDLKHSVKELRAALAAAEAPPPPPPAKPKAPERCSEPKCRKVAYAWDDDGKGWCKRHAHDRGLLAPPEPEPEEAVAEAVAAPEPAPSLGILILSGPNGAETPVDGQWVRGYFPEANDGQGLLDTTPDAAKALPFADRDEAYAYWAQEHGERNDGTPNRPLTYYAVDWRPLP